MQIADNVVLAVLSDQAGDAYADAAELARERCSYESDEEFEAAMFPVGDHYLVVESIFWQMAQVVGW